LVIRSVNVIDYVSLPHSVKSVPRYGTSQIRYELFMREAG
jgi:hypothetical protein